jgi:hypothetical protein
MSERLDRLITRHLSLAESLVMTEGEATTVLSLHADTFELFVDLSGYVGRVGPLMGHLAGVGRTTRAWGLTVVGGMYLMEGDGTDDLAHGDLAALAEAGDPRVRDGVVVTAVDLDSGVIVSAVASIARADDGVEAWAEQRWETYDPDSDVVDNVRTALARPVTVLGPEAAQRALLALVRQLADRGVRAALVVPEGDSPTEVG